ncbi:PASTA domain-containing protein [Desulfovibrio sulfodismutans]|uniref:PASTA domain-containing protein n=1 Tax=Desulfolutivibrio sulfodismutans TaxID=63561 RepID=A0A7K3NIN3_9BACT|nr:penicillin-binding transpeptidase domain-containing protein [Desulfolutivibrio sulfodismutans]NDY56054.1 PASTA domain-containing protein [Desulfolutivibrio sulfodismutans]QLA12310.1 PASTA domain-containing protein [Desulfolutivibrio sulfodismutans DSM 3696]
MRNGTKKVASERDQKRVRDWSRAKLTFVGVVFALVLTGLWVRAGYLQIVQGPDLARLALRQHMASESDRGERGQIFDRSGRLMAKTVEFTAVSVRPKELTDLDAAANQLGGILRIKPAWIKKKLESTKPFVYISRRVDDKASAEIRQANIPGVYLEAEHGRSYPNRHLAGQVLGFVGMDDQGLEGLELSFDDWLAGRRAKYAVQRDASGRKLYFDAQGRELQNLRGHDLTLTLDSQIQYFAEEELAKAVTANHGKAGTCLVVHVPTGEILAWANYPFFNPNASRNINPKEGRNRSALDVVEPGSTMKPLIIAAALQEGLVKPETSFFCENGKFKVGVSTIKDTHSYGDLTVSKIIRWSSNIGAAKIGMLLGPKRLHAYFEKCGFGVPTGLPLSGEGKGLVRSLKDWQPIDTATVSFGQGVAVTPIQLAQAFLILANDGVKKPLKLVLDPPQAAADAAPVRVFDAEVARTVQRMMREVVHEEKGTGRIAQIEGVEVGGKTGTAQKASPTGGYGDKYLASFVAFVPAETPQYLVMVMVDEPEPSHYGGVVSAPAVREVMQKTLSYLGHAPDTGRLAKGAEQTPAAAAVADGQAAGGKGSGQKTDILPPPVIDDALAEVVAVPPGLLDSPAIPNFSGMPLRRVVEILVSKGIVPKIEGQGLVVTKQSPAPGAPWPGVEKNQEFVLWLTRPS